MNPVWHPPRVILRSFGPRIQSACQVGTSLNRQKVFMHTLHMTFLVNLDASGTVCLSSVTVLQSMVSGPSLASILPGVTEL